MYEIRSKWVGELIQMKGEWLWPSLCVIVCIVRILFVEVTIVTWIRISHYRQIPVQIKPVSHDLFLSRAWFPTFIRWLFLVSHSFLPRSISQNPHWVLWVCRLKADLTASTNHRHVLEWYSFLFPLRVVMECWKTPHLLMWHTERYHHTEGHWLTSREYTIQSTKVIYAKLYH